MGDEVKKRKPRKKVDKSFLSAYHIAQLMRRLRKHWRWEEISMRMGIMSKKVRQSKKPKKSDKSFLYGTPTERGVKRKKPWLK